MTDLVSLVVTVRPTEPVTVPGHLGRAAHALLLRWLSAHDPALAQQWHDTDGPKPFTCSTLVGGRRAGQNVRTLTPEQSYWLRLTGLDPAISAVLLAQQTQPPAAIELDGITLAVECATADPAQHPWAGAVTYQALAEPHLLARQEPPRRLKLRLISPAAFRQNEMNMPVPLPDLVFGGLCDRWNAFSTIALSEEVRRYAGACMALNSFALRSRAVPMKGDSVQIGAVGTAGYVAVRYDRYWMGLVALLADFAFYAGVGRMTTVGMGQTRRIDA